MRIVAYASFPALIIILRSYSNIVTESVFSQFGIHHNMKSISLLKFIKSCKPEKGGTKLKFGKKT